MVHTLHDISVKGMRVIAIWLGSYGMVRNHVPVFNDRNNDLVNAENYRYLHNEEMIMT